MLCNKVLWLTFCNYYLVWEKLLLDLVNSISIVRQYTLCREGIRLIYRGFQSKKQVCTASNVLWFLNAVKSMPAVSEVTIWVKSPHSWSNAHTYSFLSISEQSGVLQVCPDATHWIVKLACLCSVQGEVLTWKVKRGISCTKSLVWLAGSDYAKEKSRQRRHVAGVRSSYSRFKTRAAGEVEILIPTSLWKGQ